jgi:hypothetical protein
MVRSVVRSMGVSARPAISRGESISSSSPASSSSSASQILIAAAATVVLSVGEKLTLDREPACQRSLPPHSQPHLGTDRKLARHLQRQLLGGLGAGGEGEGGGVHAGSVSTQPLHAALASR